jgi:hypothetical protein
MNRSKLHLVVLVVGIVNGIAMPAHAGKTIQQEISVNNYWSNNKMKAKQ